MATDFAQLRVSDPKGKASFEIVVSEATTLFNLHRVLQFCIKPRQSDSVIDCKPFTFTHVASGKKVKAPKTTQLYRANQSKNTAELAVGDAYTYEADKGLKGGGKDRYLVEVVAMAFEDGRYFVPRCISGAADLDAVNRKLLLRHFRAGKPMTPKAPPKVWCLKGTTLDDVMPGFLSRMKRPVGASR